MRFQALISSLISAEFLAVVLLLTFLIFGGNGRNALEDSVQQEKFNSLLVADRSSELNAQHALEQDAF